MYYIGEGDDKKPVFENGDKVRIKDSSHEFCGMYGEVVAVGVEDDLVLIKNKDDRSIQATQSQLEAN